MLKDKALEYFMSGYSCSESVVQACIDAGLCPSELLPCATTFSGGMSSGCACGAVTGAQMVLGYLFGRNNKFNNQVFAREKAAQLVEEFRSRNRATCCRALSAGLAGMERKQHCCKMVSDACDILENLIDIKVAG
jgi:C_GCAxxG_C_C family probable redox protein